jgi:hypothetical protein
MTNGRNWVKIDTNIKIKLGRTREKYTIHNLKYYTFKYVR